MTNEDPHDEIARIEGRIEELAARVENCRKFILAARIAMAGGGIVLVALFFGAIRPDPALLAGGAAAVLGGIVMFGSNNSTAKEAADELTALEAARSALIAELDLHLVAERPTLH